MFVGFLLDIYISKDIMKQTIFEHVQGNQFKLKEIFREVPGAPLHSDAAFLKKLTPIQTKVMKLAQKMGMEVYRVIPVRDMVRQELDQHNTAWLKNVRELDQNSIALFMKPVYGPSQWYAIITSDGLVNSKDAVKELTTLSKLNRSKYGPQQAK